jgi:hypothetical protein
LTDNEIDLENLVDHFHRQLEEREITPKKLYALSNMLLREVVALNGRFRSIEHFRRFEFEQRELT